jgi:hypothetical protein
MREGSFGRNVKQVTPDRTSDGQGRCLYQMGDEERTLPRSIVLMVVPT